MPDPAQTGVMDFARLRQLLCDVAYGLHGAIDRLQSYLLATQHYLAEYVRADAPYGPGTMARFGIHRCSGCGGDPEWLKGKHGSACAECAGSGWHHECDARPGVFCSDDPDYPGWGFTVQYRPGMFEPNPGPGWVPRWMKTDFATSSE